MIFLPARFSASSTAWHCFSSMTIGFSVMTSMPRSSALMMYSLWKPSTVVTISRSGFALSIISSKLVKVGHETPIDFFAVSRRIGLMSDSPTNSTASA